ncbi:MULTISPECIES: PAS domain S-box protein [unclassified Haloferax]|uniref:PAS domain S-box protein n=1 Tax=unclassified Haloferax TaxID=2625095 RepID=UPI0028768C90|nr:MULTISPECIES: PAS domain S-box protein [unclassified Haloferax]MDS0243322.1 PAS domain S-box protein [Haloferax sp. S2CR25]MDS0446443.1 PAS domain S-box protein [Haloferax sp. S2CR25-2]
MSDSRVVLVDECPDDLVEAVERRGFTTESCAGPDAVFDVLDGGVGGVVLCGDVDTGFVSRVRGRAGVVPVFFLVGDGTASAGESAHGGGAIALDEPEVPAAADSVAARVERVIEFSRWASSDRNSDSLYRTVVEQSHDAIFVTQGGEFRFWNRRLTELTGLSDGELAETPVLSVVHSDDRERAAAIAATRRRGGDAPVSYETRIVDADGNTRECSANVREIEYHGSYGVLVSVRDVTEQRATEARFRGLVELARDLVTLVGTDGRIRYQSPSVADVLGFEPGELVGRSVSDLIHPDDWEDVEEVFERALQTGADGTDPVRYRHRNAEGSWTWLESVGSNQTDTSVDGFVVTSRNVTEQRSYEQRLKRYETIVESIGQGAYVVDEAGVVQFINEAALSRTNIPMSAFVGRHVSALCDAGYLAADQYERAEAALDAVLGGESERERFEIELSLPEEVYVVEFTVSPIVGDDGEVVGAVAISTDVTERKRYEQRLNALHASTRRLTGATSREEVADIVREAATEILDYAISGVLLYDESLDALVPAAFTDEAWAVFGDVPPIPRGTGLTWEVFERGEHNLYRDVDSNPRRAVRDAGVREELIVPIPDHGVFFVASLDEGELADQRIALAKVLAANTRAVLDRVERERLLRKRERELASQNEQLESFASVVSHDLKNPLNAAMGYLDLAREQYGGDELDRVADAHERMAAIVEDVLALARNGQMVEAAERLPLRPVAEAAWTTAAGGAPEATLAVDGDVAVDAHRGRLRQLLENLFSNAVRHGGDDVTVRVGPLGDRDGFYVADDGPGIPPDERPRIFEAGYTTSSEGTGFGLSVVMSVVNAHGWSVWFVESDDGGARFEITTESDH